MTDANIQRWGGERGDGDGDDDDNNADDDHHDFPKAADLRPLYPQALSAIGNCRAAVDSTEDSVIFATNWGWTWGADGDCFESFVWAQRNGDTYSWTNAPGAACHRRRCLIAEDGSYVLQVGGWGCVLLSSL